MPTRRIWLTGSSGFIGRQVVREFQEAGAHLLCLTNNRERAVSQAQHGHRFLDYSSPHDVRRAVEESGLPDAFIHLGWGGMTDPGAPVHLGANVSDSANLVRTLFQAGLGTFVFLGSVNEYGAHAGLLVEDVPAEGRMTDYAKGKAEVARIGLDEARAHDRIFVSIRLFYTYGPGQREGALINTLYRCHFAGVPPDLGPCEHYRDYIHVRDVAEGIRRVSDAKESAVVNLGSGRAVQVREFVRMFWQALGHDPAEIRFGANPMRAGEPEQPHAYARLERLRKLTGWTPGIPLEEGIRLTIEEMRREPT